MFLWTSMKIRISSKRYFLKHLSVAFGRTENISTKSTLNLYWINSNFGAIYKCLELNIGWLNNNFDIIYVYRAQLYGLTLLFVQSSSATACERQGGHPVRPLETPAENCSFFMGKRHRANAIENSVTSTSNDSICDNDQSNSTEQAQGLRKPVHKVTRALNCPTAL